MVSRGFQNDGRPDRARSSPSDSQRTVTKIMNAGHPYRQYLDRVEFQYDTKAWQGVPGADVAASILTAVTTHIDQCQFPTERQQQLRVQAALLLQTLGSA